MQVWQSTIYSSESRILDNRSGWQQCVFHPLQIFKVRHILASVVLQQYTARQLAVPRPCAMGRGTTHEKQH